MQHQIRSVDFVENLPWHTNYRVFTWFGKSGLGNGTYQFQATATNNLNQSPVDLPSQYWQTMIIDMQNRGSITYLPIVYNNAP